MAFRASNQIPPDGLVSAKHTALRVKSRLEGFITRSTSGEVAASLILNVLDELRGARLTLIAVRDIPTIGTYASEVEDDGTYDVTAEFNAMLTEIDAALAWIAASLPQDGSGYLLVTTLNAQHEQESRTFPPAQLDGLRTALQGVVDSIT